MSDSVQCPECGDKFDSAGGMGAHRKFRHGVPLEERFWDKADRGDDGECWEWEASGDGDGYGVFGFDGSTSRAHRVAYYLEYGGLDALERERREGATESVLHHCDNRQCVNPSHLYLSGVQENGGGTVARGIALTGEKGESAELTEEEVVEIRERYARTDVTQRELADDYGIAKPTLGFVVRGDTWVDVDGPNTTDDEGGER